MYSPEHKEHNDLISSLIINLIITQGLGLFNFFPTQTMTAMQYLSMPVLVRLFADHRIKPHASLMRSMNRQIF